MSRGACAEPVNLDALLLELQRLTARVDALIGQQQALVDRVAALEARVPFRSVLHRDTPGHYDY